MAYQPTEQQLAECRMAAAAVSILDGVTVEIVGGWVWAWGDTYKHHKVFRQLGWGFAPAKKKWYWYPASMTYKGNIASYEKITETYGVSFHHHSEERREPND